MSADNGPSYTARSPDDAFAVLSNETRVEILRELGDSTGPLEFSKLYDRVDVSDTGQFNYHLDELVGHFVRKTDAGYELRQAGRRVIMAVQSGAVTDAPVLEPTRTTESCWYCGAPIEVSFLEERVDMYCRDCPGTYGKQIRAERRTVDTEGSGYLGYLSLPPAGLQDRSPVEVFRTAWTWHHLDMLAVGSGICPRCSAAVDISVDACEDHRTAGEFCDACGRHHAIDFRAGCTNCIFETGGPLLLALLANTDLLAFLTSHDRNPVSLDSVATVQEAHVRSDAATYAEELLSTEPLEARFTFTVDGETLSLTVDRELSVLEVSSGAP